MIIFILTPHGLNFNLFRTKLYCFIVTGKQTMAKEPAKEPTKERVLGDVAAEWQVNLPDGIHHVEIEHGTTSGKRVIRVDEKEVYFIIIIIIYGISP